jgi:hypothetical protein
LSLNYKLNEEMPLSPPPLHKHRKFVTTGVGFTFLVVGITGLIFKFFFKNHVLEDIHGWLGVALVGAAILHIIQNWKPLLDHFRDRRVFGLLIPVAFVIVFFSMIQQETVKKVNPRQVVRRLAQANAGDLAKVFGKDPNSVLTSMKSSGLQVEGTDETINDLAKKNNTSTDGILLYFVQ